MKKIKGLTEEEALYLCTTLGSQKKTRFLSPAKAAFLLKTSLDAGEMKIDCQYCHTGVVKGRHALVPSANICMNCHTVAKKKQPEIIKLAKYYEEQTPIPWKRIHKVPEYAYFNHSVHVNKGMECETCHGNIADMEIVSQMRGWTMTACLDCHRNPQKELPYLENVKNGPTHCAACHR